MTLNDSEFQNFMETGSGDYLTSTRDRNQICIRFCPKPLWEMDKLLAQPFMFSPAILCYNRDHFTEKGLLEPDSSWSWDELFETADKLAVENERIGFHFSVSQRNRYMVFLLQNGAVFEKDSNGNLKINRYKR